MPKPTFILLKLDTIQFLLDIQTVQIGKATVNEILKNYTFSCLISRKTTKTTTGCYTRVSTLSAKHSITAHYHTDGPGVRPC